MMTAIRTTGAILKLRIGSFVALGALAGFVADAEVLRPIEALVFALAVLGASGAAGAFNHYHERDTDRLMRRTRNRPFADGTLKPGAIWPLSFLALLVASLAMAWSVGGTLATALVFAGAFTYGIVYTVWLKTRTVWNIVIGGAAGSFAVLAGAAAAGGIGPVAIILAIVLFLWTPPHFWALAAVRGEDYRQAGVPMLPVVVPEHAWTRAIFAHVVVLAALSLLPLAYGMGPAYGICAALGGGLFVKRAWVLLRDPGPKTALWTFFASLTQFALLALGVVLDTMLAWAL